MNKIKIAESKSPRPIWPSGSGTAIKWRVRRMGRVFLAAALPGLAQIAEGQLVATGGDLTAHIEQNGTYYRVHVFTNASGTLVVDTGGEIEYLIVAGGGGGGSMDSGAARCTGGGGAGGVRAGTLSVAAGSYPISVGGGGGGGIARVAGTDGGSTTGFGLTAIGGGGGATQNANGRPGGSGGGGSTTGGTGGAGTEGQGYAGGSSASEYRSGGGGGGGAGGAGQDPINRVGGAGGAGLDFGSGIAFGLSAAFGIGDAGWFAGGGGGTGGGAYDTFALEPGGTGGAGGGGQGGRRLSAFPGADAMPHTGGGGGGGTGGGGQGGSGILIVRYAVDVDDIPFVDVDAFTLADPRTGSTSFTASNEVSVTAFPVPVGFDRFQITTSGAPESLTANWLETDAIPATLAFSRPAADTRITRYAWFTNSAAPVTVRRGTGSIYYTEIEPQVAARPIVRRFLSSGSPVKIALTDFRPPRGGTADGRQLAVRSVELFSSDTPSPDLTPEDTACVTLDAPGIYPLVLRIENEAGTVVEKQLDAILAPPPAGMRTLFADNFETGTWADSDAIPGFWSRSNSTLCIEHLMDAQAGRLIAYIVTGANTKALQFWSQNRALFDFSGRTITLKLVDIEQHLPRTLIANPSWRLGIGFGKDPNMRVDQGIADSIHFRYSIASSGASITLYRGTEEIGSLDVTGTGQAIEGNYADWAFPINIDLSIGPAKAYLWVELSDGSTRTISGAHGFNAAATTWMQSPALNLYFHASNAQGPDNPMGLSMDAIFVTIPQDGTVLMVR